MLNCTPNSTDFRSGILVCYYVELNYYLVAPSQVWNLLEAQYGLAAISGTDIARWYASTQIPFDRTFLLSVNIYRDMAAYNRVTELQMQMFLQLSEKS